MRVDPVPDALVGRLGVAIAKLNERNERVAEIDSTSEAVLTEVARTLEENRWMLAAQVIWAPLYS